MQVASASPATYGAPWSFANLPVSRENLREVTKRKEEEEEENSRAERIVPYSSHMRLVVYIGLHN